MIKIFNSNYEEIGDLNKNLALHTLGKIKIRYGRKYIDLLNDKGELNVNIPKILLEKDSLDDINSNGFYLVDGNLYAYYNGNIYQITSSEEGNFISFSDELNLSLEYINIALKNIGLKFNSIDEALSNIDNGIFFVGDKIYYNNGDTVKELTLKEPLSSINNENLGVPLNNKVVLAYINGKWQYALYLSKDDIISIVKQYSGGKGLELNTPLEEINNAELDDPSVKKVSEIEPIEYDDDTTLPTVIAYNKTGTDESGKDVNSWYYETVVPFSIFKQCCEYMKLKIEELEQKIEDMIPKKVIWWWTETDMNNNELKYHEALVMKNQIPTWEDYQDPDSKNYTGTYIDSTKKFNLWNEDWTTIQITSDTNYFALWDNKEYWTVRWLKNEQDTPEGEFITSVMDGEIATIPATLPEIEGKVFLKWDYDNTPITQNTDIYALWNDIKLFIELDKNTVSSDGDTVHLKFWVEKGEEIILDNIIIYGDYKNISFHRTNEIPIVENNKNIYEIVIDPSEYSELGQINFHAKYENLEETTMLVLSTQNILLPDFDFMRFGYSWKAPSASLSADLDQTLRSKDTNIVFNDIDKKLDDCYGGFLNHIDDTLESKSKITINLSNTYIDYYHDEQFTDYSLFEGRDKTKYNIYLYFAYSGDGNGGNEQIVINWKKLLENSIRTGNKYIYIYFYTLWYNRASTDGSFKLDFKLFKALLNNNNFFKDTDSYIFLENDNNTKEIDKETTKKLELKIQKFYKTLLSQSCLNTIFGHNLVFRYGDSKKEEYNSENKLYYEVTKDLTDIEFSYNISLISNSNKYEITSTVISYALSNDYNTNINSLTFKNSYPLGEEANYLFIKTVIKYSDLNELTYILIQDVKRTTKLSFEYAVSDDINCPLEFPTTINSITNGLYLWVRIKNTYENDEWYSYVAARVGTNTKCGANTTPIVTPSATLYYDINNKTATFVAGEVNFDESSESEETFEWK